ncbi:hypothetical protein FRC03_005298 [Tulasnella sp. 419]|nr:hypothetical protein FRC03_005298 [Tulasnella sp. 419]
MTGIDPRLTMNFPRRDTSAATNSSSSQVIANANEAPPPSTIPPAFGDPSRFYRDQNHPEIFRSRLTVYEMKERAISGKLSNITSHLEAVLSDSPNGLLSTKDIDKSVEQNFNKIIRNISHYMSASKGFDFDHETKVWFLTGLETKISRPGRAKNKKESPEVSSSGPHRAKRKQHQVDKPYQKPKGRKKKQAMSSQAHAMNPPLRPASRLDAEVPGDSDITALDFQQLDPTINFSQTQEHWLAGFTPATHIVGEELEHPPLPDSTIAAFLNWDLVSDSGLGTTLPVHQPSVGPGASSLVDTSFAISPSSLTVPWTMQQQLYSSTFAGPGIIPMPPTPCSDASTIFSPSTTPPHFVPNCRSSESLASDFTGSFLGLNFNASSSPSPSQYPFGTPSQLPASGPIGGPYYLAPHVEHQGFQLGTSQNSVQGYLSQVSASYHASISSHIPTSVLSGF